MINVFQPVVGKESLDNLSAVFASNWLGRGKMATRFLQELASFIKCDTQHLHTIASCSDAIFAVFRVFDWPKGAKVIIPSISFPAVGSAVLEYGLTPVIVDIDITTGNIAIDALRQHYSSDVAAIFVTDYGGVPCDVAAIREMVGDDTLIFQDVAAALGTFVDGEFSGRQADFCCWSFDAMKLVTCGEGGGAYFKDPARTTRFKEHTYLGFGDSATSGLNRAGSGTGTWWEYNPVCPGSRSIFTDVNAAIGLPSLRAAEQALSVRAEVRTRYVETIDQLSGLDYLRQDQANIRYANYFFTVKSQRRNQLATFLKNAGIYSTFRYHPLHNMDLFKSYAEDCSNADLFSGSMLNIPMHQSLSEDDVEYICSKLIEFDHT